MITLLYVQQIVVTPHILYWCFTLRVSWREPRSFSSGVSWWEPRSFGFGVSWQEPRSFGFGVYSRFKVHFVVEPCTYCLKLASTGGLGRFQSLLNALLILGFPTWTNSSYTLILQKNQWPLKKIRRVIKQDCSLKNQIFTVDSA